MEKIYTAADLTEAHLLKHLLELAGIEISIFNENALGAMGELPHTPPELWLIETRRQGQAKKIIRDFENRPLTEKVIVCSHCSEDNPGTFETCWHCARQLPI